MTMPPDPPTWGEVVRTLDRIERNLGARIDDLQQSIAQSVSAEVFEAHRQALVTQLTVALAEIEEVRTEARREVDELKKELAKERSERRADRRVIIGAVLAIVGTALAAFFGWK